MKLIIFIGLLATVCSAVDLPGIPTNFNGSTDVLNHISDDVARKFEKEYLSFLKTGVESAALKQMSAQLSKIHSKNDLFRKDIAEMGAADQFFICTTCRATVNVLSRMVREEDGELNGPDSEAQIRSITLEVCNRLSIQSEEVCGGLFDCNWNSLEYIIKNSQIDNRSLCSLFMGINLCSVKNTDWNWSLNINSNGPEITSSKSYTTVKNSENINILHISDMHYDPDYLPGSLAVCDKPLCCQSELNNAADTDKAAGYWGDYRNCDAPLHMLENAFEHIKATHTNIDYIYQTGDIVDHMVWATSVERNTKALTDINNRLVEHFPNINIYPCIGNHEPHPLNLFSPEDVPDDVNSKWLYETLWSFWSNWLPESTKETILKGGYYTVSPKVGFRIVVLNNVFCYIENFWLYYSGADKATQLEWLHDTLLKAEADGEKVHVLGHHPTGDTNCWTVWAREYNRIIERFSNTISGMFVGHSHRDEMHVHYNTEGHALSVSWNGGSLTPYSYKNPNYKIYEVEPDTMHVVDFVTWIFNLAEANQNGKDVSPNWYKEYEFAAEFTNNLSPAGIDALLEKMAENPDLLRKFWRLKMTSSEPRLSEGCDRDCLLTTLCRMATSVNDQLTRCEALTSKLEIALDDEPTVATTAATTAATTPSPSLTTEVIVVTTPKDDGAVALMAFQLTTIISLFLLVINLF